MLAPSDVERDFPSNPLPVNARDAVYDSLRSRGFKRDGMIVDNYAFSGQNGSLVTTNAIAFADEIRRGPDYTSLTVFNPVNGESEASLAQVLAHSAAPFHLIHREREQSFSLWYTTVSDQNAREIKAERVADQIAYYQLRQVLDDYAVDINPKRIVDVKQGRDAFRFFDQAAGYQLALWALDVTEPLLVERFRYAVNQLRQYDAIPDIEITNLAVQLLGATILAHTGKIWNIIPQQDPSLHELINAAHRAFPTYFDTNLFEQWENAATSAYERLIELRFSGFAPEMLSALYREAYPEKEVRRERGRYDTPLYLTRRIWDTIPVEFLPPEERVVADMTCGWGSFLISGYDRLSRLVDMQDVSLRDYIHGNDRNPFTARLARLGLLISTLQDNWHIDDQDAFNWGWLRNRPSIIVGNPPFGSDRKTQRGQGKRIQEADRFLDEAIDSLAPNGYLAMVMPQSFLAGEASPKLRQKLLQTCDVLEIWDLPISVFDAQVSTLVLFAQKKVGNGAPVRVRTLQSNALEHFKQSGIFTASSLVSSQSDWNEHARKSKGSVITHIMDYKVILPEYVWNNILSNSTELENVAFVSMGAIVGQNPDQKTWRDYKYPKEVPWLSGADSIPKPFLIAHDLAQTVQYPNDLVRPGKDKRYPHDPTKGKEHLFMGQKVLIISDPNPSWGKRVKVAIDRKGYYVSNTFYMVKSRSIEPYKHISNEVLAAVLDWYVSNAWIVEHLKYPWVEKRIIQSLPFPRQLTQSDCQVITRAIQEIERSVAVGLDRPRQAVRTIDSILKRAYQIDEETLERLRLVSEWDNEPQTTLDTQPSLDADWKISGIVESVDVENGTITLWIKAFDDLQTVPVSSVMPGWLLRPGVAFRTQIPRNQLKRVNITNRFSWRKFYPQQYTYLKEEELLDEITKVFYPESLEPHDTII